MLLTLIVLIVIYVFCKLQVIYCVWSFIKRQTSGTSRDNEWQRMTTSDNEWQQMTTIGTTSDDEWQQVTTNDNEWQRMTTSDNEWCNKWQRVTASGNEWQWVTASDSSGTANENGTVHLKEWMIAVLSMRKPDTLLLQGMDGWN